MREIDQWLGFYAIDDLATHAEYLFSVPPSLARSALMEDGKPPYSVAEAAEIIEEYKRRQVGGEEERQERTPRTIYQKPFTTEDKTKLDTLWDNQQAQMEDFTAADLIRVFTDEEAAKDDTDE